MNLNLMEIYQAILNFKNQYNYKKKLISLQFHILLL
jgi:hypothetical protein